MTPREVITRNLEMSGPERIGLAFNRGRRNDFHRAGLGPSLTWRQRRWVEGDYEYYDDPWGNTWHRIVGRSAKGEIWRPALASWDRLADLALPDFDDPARYAAAAAAFRADPDHYHLASLPGFPFAICRYLRKMEVYFQDLILERPRVDALHERVTGLLERVIDRWAAAGADGVIFAEDWGTQERLLISPAMWREIFGPLFRRLCARAHGHRLHVLMHSCGYNWDILGDLAAAGVNAFQFDQPALYGLERLAARLRELRVCLYSPVDIQRVMPSGDRALIEEHARRMVALFGDGDGGLIATCYGDLPGISVTPEADDWAYRAFCAHRLLPAGDGPAPCR